MEHMDSRKHPQRLACQLRNAFQRSGMTRYELAKRTNIPYSTIHRFMAGERDITLSTVEKMCDVLTLELRHVRRKGK